MDAQTILTHSWWVAPIFLSCSINIFDQKPTGFLIFSSCFCNNTHNSWLSMDRLFTVYCPSFLNKNNMSKEMGFLCKVYRAVRFALFSYTRAFRTSWSVLQYTRRIRERNLRQTVESRNKHWWDNVAQLMLSALSSCVLRHWCGFLFQVDLGGLFV